MARTRWYLFLLASAGLLAQPAAFEVATIRSSGPAPSPETRNAMRIQRGPEYFDFPRISIRDLVMLGYGVDATQVIAPEWMRTEYFDISAKASAPVTMAQAHQMFRALLADRFHLVFHRESRTMPVYVLTAAKSGVKLVESTPERVDPRGAPLPEQKEGGSLWIEPGKGLVKNYMRSEDGVTLASGRSARMADIVFFLDRRLRVFDAQRKLIDKTGLAGAYDFGIQFVDPSRELRGNARSDLPGIFRAVEESLGLKIDSGNEPVEVLVLDSAERTPTAN